MGCAVYVRFSNRPIGVKRYQAVHDYGIDVAHGLVFLFCFESISTFIET